MPNIPPTRRGELSIIEAAAQAHAAYGPDCITHYIVSMTETVSDLLEVHILLKEVGLYHPGDDPPFGDHGHSVVRDNRRSGTRRRHNGPLFCLAGDSGLGVTAGGIRK